MYVLCASDTEIDVIQRFGKTYPVKINDRPLEASWLVHASNLRQKEQTEHELVRIHQIVNKQAY